MLHRIASAATHLPSCLLVCTVWPGLTVTPGYCLQSPPTPYPNHYPPTPHTPPHTQASMKEALVRRRMRRLINAREHIHQRRIVSQPCPDHPETALLPDPWRLRARDVCATCACQASPARAVPFLHFRPQGCHLILPPPATHTHACTQLQFVFRNSCPSRCCCRWHVADSYARCCNPVCCDRSTR